MQSVCVSNLVEAVGDERAEVYPHKLKVGLVYRVVTEHFIELTIQWPLATCNLFFIIIRRMVLNILR